MADDKNFSWNDEEKKPTSASAPNSASSFSWDDDKNPPSIKSTNPATTVKSQTTSSPSAFQRFGQSLRSSLGFEPTGTAAGDIKTIASGLKQIATHPINSADLLLHGAANAQQDVIDKAFQEQQSADPWTKARGYVRGAESAIPFLGPVLSQAGDQFRSGDVAGGLGTMTPILAEPLVEHGRIPATNAAKAAADKLIRGTPITEAGKLAAAKNQALAVKKPSMTEIEYSQKVSDVLPELQKIAQDNKGQIKTPRQAVQAISNRISQIEAPIGEHIKGLNEPHQMLPAEEVQGKINQAVDTALAKKPGSYKPTEIEKAKKTVTDFIGDNPKSLTEIEGNRRRLNQDADAYYNTDTAGKRAIDVSDATAVAQRAAADAIRNILYGDENNPGALEKAGVSAVDMHGEKVPLREIRRRVGNLLDIKDHFEDAITKAEATGDWKLLKQFHTGPSLAAGGLGAVGGMAAGGPIGSVMGLLLGEGAKSWGDYLRSKNPNLNVQKMFRNLENTSTSNTASIQTQMAPIPPSQMTLGLPGENQSLFNIQQTPKLRPDFETARIPPIRGEQQPLGLPPENAALFNLNVPNPAGRFPKLTKLGGKVDVSNPQMEAQTGRFPRTGPSKGVFAGTAENISKTPNVRTTEIPAASVKVGDTFIDEKGEARRIEEVAGNKIKAKDGDVKTYTGKINARGKLNSPESQGKIGARRKGVEGGSQMGDEAEDFLKKIGAEEVPEVEHRALGEEEPPTGKVNTNALQLGAGEDLGAGLGTEHILSKGGKRIGSITVEPRAGGVLHVHWLGGDMNGLSRTEVMDALKREYPDTAKITYDRRRLAKGAEAATAEPREMSAH